jgi:hypothetical protein
MPQSSGLGLAKNPATWKQKTALPMPVVPMPVPVPMPTAMPVMVPAAVPVPVPTHLFRFQMFHLVCAGDGGTNISIPRQLVVGCRERQRCQRRSLCACRKRGRAGDCTQGEFQKVSAFHDFSFLFH